MNTTQNNGSITPNQHNDEADKLINEEIARNKVEKDEIYEGGEEEGVQDNYQFGNDDKELEENEEDNEDDSTDDEEFDIEADDDDADQKRQKKKLKLITDWRTEYNAITAFFYGKLRKNDY